MFFAPKSASSRRRLPFLNSPRHGLKARDFMAAIQQPSNPREIPSLYDLFVIKTSPHHGLIRSPFQVYCAALMLSGQGERQSSRRREEAEHKAVKNLRLLTSAATVCHTLSIGGGIKMHPCFPPTRRDSCRAPTASGSFARRWFYPANARTTLPHHRLTTDGPKSDESPR